MILKTTENRRTCLQCDVNTQPTAKRKQTLSSKKIGFYSLEYSVFNRKLRYNIR